MKNYKNIVTATILCISSIMMSSAMAAATFVIDVQDGPTEGFNDPTVVTPIGGNTGTTLGEQRLKVFERAGEIWGGFINSDVPIVISAQFDPQTCTAQGAVLGSAGATFIFRNFAFRPFANTWYGSALADAISGSDRNPGEADINATFNSEIDNGCFGNGWYYGIDGATPAGFTSLLPVVLHELGHGLGSQTFTNGSTGAFQGGFKDAWSHFMTDLSAESTWGDLPNNADRAASALNNGFLVWDGPSVNQQYRQVLNTAANVVELKINFPAVSNHVAGTASFGDPVPANGFSGNVKLAIDDETGPNPLGDVNDGCSPITNNLSGHIAIINRGSCDFVEKVANAQAAGANGVLITNNVNIGISGMSGTNPSVTIPSIFISKVVGDNIKTELGNGGVSVTMGFTTEAHAGANNGHVRLYAPTTFSGGSSVSHWDTVATPSLLMEPNITPALFDQIDLTFNMFQDIGWDVVIVDDIYENGFEAP